MMNLNKMNIPLLVAGFEYLKIVKIVTVTWWVWGQSADLPVSRPRFESFLSKTFSGIVGMRNST